ncbi:hypothetical protein CVT26_009886 [Gymnopilus dilepis]|uniref:F-box domain-containing protein n=1 Tax=Gymnopilus dilepis TaxID=231916 RepID=A0A409YC28_9AGAR|nr:hypothetical protein CVT26_009886 [Gymnopilus dilepis]
MDNPNEGVQSPSTSPISRLHADILWLIFLRNTDVQDFLISSSQNIFQPDSEVTQDSVLDTTLISARVCQRWRSLLLNWPALWGRVLLLNRLHQLGKEGREEIVRRTGTAPLYLIGDVTSIAQIVDEFVGPLLKANWERVRMIHIQAEKHVIRSESLWNTFILKSPMLEWFSVEGAAWSQQRVIPEDLVVDLFGDFAPQLRVFRCDTVAFTLSGSRWFNNLQELHLASTGVQPSNVLNNLKQMPLLENLHLKDLRGNVDHTIASVGPGSISLPRLVGLSLDLPLCWALLFSKSIKPAENCTLSFRPDMPTDFFTQKDAAEIIEVLERYADTYFPFHRVSYINITLAVGQFSFSVRIAERTSSGLVDLPISQSNFAVHLNFWGQIAQSVDCSSFLAPFLKHDLSNIQTLALEIDQLKAGSWNNVRPIIASLRGVETLKVGSRISTLDVLNRYHVDETQIFFPALRALHLESEFFVAFEFEGSFRRFISRRQRANVSFLRVLNLGYSPNDDWSFLDEIEGLTVVWAENEDFEYTCGSGSPWELTFSDSEIEDDSMEELAAAIGFPIRRQRRW